MVIIFLSILIILFILILALIMELLGINKNKELERFIIMNSDDQTLNFLLNDQAKYLAMRKKFKVEEELRKEYEKNFRD